MEGAPILADEQNVDLHQGDWEHVTVLLDPHTLTPRWLYTARHDDEGVLYRWSDSALTFDGEHPIVQAAFGGHPTYPGGCGERGRKKHPPLSDWLVCGSGRFAFRGSTTPLVDLGDPSIRWPCWPGHFGESKLGFEVSTPDADTLTKAINKYVHVWGPRSPLWQAENGSLSRSTPITGYGVCDRGAGAGEKDALGGSLGAVLTRLYG
jgi:hypothetical protein